MNRKLSGAPAAAGAREHRTRVPGGRLIRASALGVLSGAVATAGLMIPAGAAVSDPHTVFVLKDDSIVEVEGLNNGENILVEVERNGVVVGSVEGTASDPGGTFIINHDVCWDGFTPQILPGDVVEVTTSGGVDTVPVTNIEVTEGPVLVGNRFTIRGRVNGVRPPVGQLQVEARTNDPIRFRPLAPDVVDGVNGSIAYDGAGGDFTATFTGLNAQQQEAVGNFGEFFVSHVAATGGAGDPKEVTMASEGTGAPGPGCPPVARHAVTSLSSPVINRANQRSPLTVSGMTLDADAVSVRLRDASGTVVTSNATITGASGPQTWSATFGRALLATLDGNVRVSATYTVAGTRVQGATMTLFKDTVAPARPSASPEAGAYSRRQSVSLSAGAGDRIRYTLGSGRQAAPTATSGSIYRGRQIRITSSQTLKAVAVDRAGNRSAVTRQRYLIGALPNRPRMRQASPGRRGGRDTAVANWRPPVANGAPVTGYRVTALRVRRNGSVVSRRNTKVLTPTTRSHEMRLRSGRYRFRVRALSRTGAGPLSARSNIVRSR